MVTVHYGTCEFAGRARKRPREGNRRRRGTHSGRQLRRDLIRRVLARGDCNRPVILKGVGLMTAGSHSEKNVLIYARHVIDRVG